MHVGPSEMMAHDKLDYFRIIKHFVTLGRMLKKEIVTWQKKQEEKEENSSNNNTVDATSQLYSFNKIQITTCVFVYLCW